MANVSKPGQGWIALKKTAGQTGAGPALTTQINLPVMGGDPRNPRNNSYPPMIHKAGAPINIVKGKRTPSISVATCAKASWFTALNLNSLIGGSTSFLDTNLDSDEYAVALNEPPLGTRVYDGARFTALTVAWSANAASPVAVQLAGPCVYGDNEKGTPTSFSAPTTDAGQLYNISDIVISGADMVPAGSFTILRGQAPVMYSEGTLYATQVCSGVIGGTLTLAQSPTYSSTPSSTFSITIGPSTSGVKFTFALNLDEGATPFTNQFGQTSLSYTLIDSSAGAFPVTIIAAP